MNPAVQVFAEVALVAAGLLGAVCAISVATFRAVRRTEQSHLPPTADVTARLDQLQQAVDAIAVEVERIAEAQRFTARLEAERGERQALPAQR
ncbi:MAG TPA: hypothetical protein VFP90_01555 [Gemmatimonadaceae bacterium]|nr:hypothetical protein [Gemmatimonadaceae bacterium]